MCTGRILPDAIPKSTNSIWQTSITPPLIEDSLVASDWAVVFRSTRWQDSHRDPDPRHDHVRSIISMAPNLKFSHLSCDISSSTSSTHLCNDVKSVLWWWCFPKFIQIFLILCIDFLFNVWLLHFFREFSINQRRSLWKKNWDTLCTFLEEQKNINLAS